MRSVATMAAFLLLLGAPSADPIEPIPCAFLPVYFDVGSVKLRGDAARYLITGYYQAFDVYNPATDARFLLTSYSADGGSERANRRLARLRVATVRRFLLSHRVPAARITIAPLHTDAPGYTEGRSVLLEISTHRSHIMRVMPPGGPVC
jgi:hypothetical protein